MKLDCLAMAEVEEYQPNICAISGTGGKNESSGSSKTTYNKKFLDPFYSDFPLPIYSNDQDGVSVQNLSGGPQMEPVLDKDGNPRYNEDGTPMMRAAKGQKNATGINAPGFQRQQFTVGLPKFQGLEDMDFDRLQSNLYNRQLQNLTPTYETERARRREELSQTGLLNSPVAFAEGGALDSLERDYFDQSQKAASDAAIQTVGLKKEELARKLGFDFDLVKMIESILGQRAQIALDSGRKSNQSGNSISGGGSFFGFGNDISSK